MTRSIDGLRRLSRLCGRSSVLCSTPAPRSPRRSALRCAPALSAEVARALRCDSSAADAVCRRLCRRAGCLDARFTSTLLLRARDQWVSDAGRADEVTTLPGKPVSADAAADSVLYSGACVMRPRRCCAMSVPACVRVCSTPLRPLNTESRLRLHHARANWSRALLRVPNELGVA